MPNQTTKRIRSLDRGLQIVEYLSNHGTSSLADLRRATGLSNATLLRVLATLQDRNWVRRNIVEGQYELAHSLGNLLGATARAHPLAELAAPVLLEMETWHFGLPSDVCAVMGPARLELVESTRMRGPMAPVRTGLGIRPSIALSAHGRAILAFGPKAETQAHLSALARSGTRQERQWLDSGRLEAELKATRERGYALREVDYFVEQAFDPGPDLGAMAVPIISAAGVFGTVSVLWLREDKCLEAVLKAGAEHSLTMAARRIAQALDAQGLEAPRII